METYRLYLITNNYNETRNLTELELEELKKNYNEWKMNENYDILRWFETLFNHKIYNFSLIPHSLIINEIDKRIELDFSGV